MSVTESRDDSSSRIRASGPRIDPIRARIAVR
jgi:hypothetical protein